MSSLGSVPKMPVDKGPLEILVEIEDELGGDVHATGAETPTSQTSLHRWEAQQQEQQLQAHQQQQQQDLMPRMSSQISTLRYLPSLRESERVVNTPPQKSAPEILSLLVSNLAGEDDDTPGLFDGIEDVRRSKASMAERSSNSSTTTAGGVGPEPFPSNEQLMEMLEDEEFYEEEMFEPREAFSKGAKGRISKAEAKFLMAGRLFGEEAHVMRRKVHHGQVGFRQQMQTSTIQQELEEVVDPASPRRKNPFEDSPLHDTDACSQHSTTSSVHTLASGAVPELWMELWDERTMHVYYSNIFTGQIKHKKPKHLIQTTISLGGVTVLCYAPPSLKQVFAAIKIQRVWRMRVDRLEAQKKRRMLLEAAENFGATGAVKRGSNTKSATDAVIEGLHEAFVACHLSGPVKEDCTDDDYQEKCAYELHGCSFKIMAPEVFKNIRQHFGVSSDDFHSSMRDQLKVMSQNAGRSGSWFFISANKKYILKSITRTEDLLLRTILPSYMEYIHTFPHTLLTRYLGLFHMRVPGRKLRLVAMSNVFASGTPAEAYDLKGSFVNRTVLQPGEKPTPGKIMKDNDLQREMRLDIIAQSMLHAQLQADTDWLTSHDIMDYSLLLGVNYVEAPDGSALRDTYCDQLSRFSISVEGLASIRASAAGSADGGDRRLPRPSDSDSSSRSSSSHTIGATKPTAATPRSASLDPMGGRRSSFRNRLRFPSRQKKPSVSIIKPVSAAGDMLSIPPVEPGTNAFMLHEGGLLGENSVTGQEEVYYIGIIDMLQQYNVNKRMERSIKRATGKAGEGISSINSTDYAARFMRYMHSIFQ